VKPPIASGRLAAHPSGRFAAAVGALRALGRRLRLRDERGVALVEFALVAPVLMVLLFGMVDFGKAINYWNDSTHLANEGARWGVVNWNPSTGQPWANKAQLQSYVAGQADTPDLQGKLGSTGVAVAFPDGVCTVGHPIKVTVNFPYNWLGVLKLLPGTATVSSSSTMRLERSFGPNSDGDCS